MIPAAFLARMREQLKDEYGDYLAALSRPPVRGLRVNPRKLGRAEFLRRFGAHDPVPWEENGFYIDADSRAGSLAEHFAGLYYLQEPSAMCAAPMLGVSPGERVLDLCAAPGGKTTRLADAMQGKGVLVANEIEFSRGRTLAQNVERMGIVNAAVVSAPPDGLARAFPAAFDKILVDAPCSGEGMFRKDPDAAREWNERSVASCAVRQAKILDEAAKMLAGGGRLVYSTCTFSEEEDERQAEDFLRRHPDFTLLAVQKLYPHRVRGEGHFAALFEKQEGERGKVKPFSRKNGEAERAYRAFEADFLQHPLDGEIATLADGRLILLPEGAPQIPAYLHLMGVELGTFDGKMFKPAHALAMAFGADARSRATLSREEAERYLRGETFAAPLQNGWCVVCLENFPLGLGKCSGGVVKNHLPKALRKAALPLKK